MASVYKRGRTWNIGWTDAAGVRHNEATKAKTRDEAKKLAAEVEARQERVRRGLEVEPGDPRMTFRKLFDTWLERHGSKLRSGGKIDSLEKHALPALGELVLRDVTPARLELLFDEMGAELAGSSVNTLRAQLRAVFGWAKTRGLWLADNPVSATEKRKELQKERDELTADEVPLVLAQLSPQRRALAAAAIGTGARKGELAALRLVDVDLAGGVVHIGRSWSADTTKGGSSKSVPIATWLRPYLVEALEAARELGSEFVFPGPSGAMMRRDAKLPAMLRRAMARAGLTRGWLHVCRRRGAKPCSFSERREHDRVEPCPACGFRLWPKPIHRDIRWHDLRATTASLLARSGASPAVAGRVLRHSDPSLTLKVYTRVRAEDMRAALDAMVPALAQPPQAPAVEPVALAAAVNASHAAAPALQRPETARHATNDAPQALAGADTSHALPARVERAASSFGGLQAPVGTAVRGVSPRASGFTSRGVAQADRNAVPRGAPPFPASDAAPALQAPIGLVPQLLTVREVASALRCSTSTVYALCERGELAHVRVSNAIRVESPALERYLGANRR